MGQTSAIEWTDASWNPWRGCHKVSAGCKNCYMFREQKRYGRDPNTIERSKTTFNDPLKWREPRMVFTCSWSDWFIEEADPWRDEAWSIIKHTPHLTYQILTKRPELIRDRLPDDWGGGYPNVWMGVSVENQDAANKRIPLLVQVPAAVRFLSCEPLLGPVDIQGDLLHGWHKFTPKLHWVIVGGESGPDCRPMDIAWARSLREQCAAAGVKFFMKQDSGPRPGMQGRIPDDLWIKEYPNAKR